MKDKSKSVLVVGFNTRPLVYSLSKAGYKVYAIDFFGDLDLGPHVEDCIIVMKELNTNYNSLKNQYSKYLTKFTINMLQKYPDIDLFLIGSGLDDAYEEREILLKETREFNIFSVNNDLVTIKKARNVDYIFELLRSLDFKTPISYSYIDFQFNNSKLKFPLILKKKRSAGGISVIKIEDEQSLKFRIKDLENSDFNPKEWLIQEYIEGIPVSCTVISNGKDSGVISVNRQIIGEEFLNSPKNFMYCGNIVPSGLSETEERKIAEISMILTNSLGLKGINGFDFVIKDQVPFFMECNPRIPGSIRASESALNLNFLDLHVRSFTTREWKPILKIIKSSKFNCFSTKFVVFAPKTIEKGLVNKINHIKFVHDKTEPTRNVLKGEPLCTILYGATTLLESYNGAKNIVNKINKIIE